MKKLIIILAVVFLAGCSSPVEPPPPTEIVLPDMYYITDPVIEIVPAD